MEDLLTYAPDGAGVFLLGALVGVAELVSRYKDDPGGALRSRPGLLYLALNALAGLFALILVYKFDWRFDLEPGDKLRWTRILLSGFGSMGLFRSSLFKVRAGDVDIGVGPSSFLQVVLNAVDREVDRLRAEARARQIGAIMAGVTFSKAAVALPTICLALMQNLPKEDQEQLGRQIQALQAPAVSDDGVKALALGLYLMNVVGRDVLAAAVASLGSKIKGPP